MTEKVNLAAKLASFSEHFSPKIVAELNNYKIEVVKAKASSFGIHTRTPTISSWCSPGHLTIQLRDRDVELGPGDLYVVPRGVEHCPKADRRGAHPPDRAEGTPNTGDAGGERTAAETRI